MLKLKTKLISIIVIISLLIVIYPFTSIADKKNIPITYNSDPPLVEKPSWNPGNKWWYDMKFHYFTDLFSVEAEIDNMLADFNEIVFYQNEQVNKLDLDGDISGKITIGPFSLADFNGVFGGYAYIRSSDLGMKKFVFEVDANIYPGSISLKFDMTMEFSPTFDFYDFPIDPSTEEFWIVNMPSVVLSAHAKVGVLPEINYENESSFETKITFIDARDILVKGKIYYSYLLEGTWGEESEIWYAPEVGFLSKLHEILNIDDINAGFDLWLLDTNFDISNEPPSQPDKPSGPPEGDTDVVYFFETSSSDKNNHNIFYKFDWGDGTVSDWIGPYVSNEILSSSHSWNYKGMYNIKVKAKDDPNGDGDLIDGVESSWSDPFVISIIGKPLVYLNIDSVFKLDEIDWDPLDSSPTLEWFYKIIVFYDDSGNKKSISNYNTIDGGDSDDQNDWFNVDNWNPGIDHEFEVEKRYIEFQIKLMDKDFGFAEGGNDLADVSGNDNPDTNGVDDDTGYFPKAIYHGTYDLVDNEIIVDNSDYFYYNPDLEVYIIRGDDPPDSSTRYEHGIKDPENDAMIWFKIFDNYELPTASASVEETEIKLRPGDDVKFLGSVSEGSPEYSWLWDFDDGNTAQIQNPTHIYSTHGVYNVNLTVTDLIGEESSCEITVELFENNVPNLTDPTVSFKDKGDVDDTFTFSVYYYDEDGDEPTEKNVVIDGSPIEMIGEGSDSTYFYECLGKDIGKGDHKCYFSFNDGYGSSVVTEELTFTVKKSKDKPYNSIMNLLERIFSNSIIIKILQKILEIKGIY